MRPSTVTSPRSTFSIWSIGTTTPASSRINSITSTTASTASIPAAIRSANCRGSLPASIHRVVPLTWPPARSPSTVPPASTPPEHPLVLGRPTGPRSLFVARIPAVFRTPRSSPSARLCFPARFLPTVPPLVRSFDLPLPRCSLLFRLECQPRPSSVRVIRVYFALYLLFDRPPQAGSSETSSAGCFFSTNSSRLMTLLVFIGITQIPKAHCATTAMLQHRGFPSTTDRHVCASRSRLRERAPPRERDALYREGQNQPRALTRPERTASFKPFLASGPDCGFVSSVTVVSTASRGVARRAERPKALERESPRGAQPKTRLMLAPDQIHFSPERGRVTKERDRDSPEWSVASDAEGGSGERGEPETTQANHATCRPTHRPGGTERGRGFDRSPDPQAPQERGAQLRPRAVEHAGAFEKILLSNH